MCSSNDILQWKKIFDIENWLWKSEFCIFWRLLLKWSQDFLVGWLLNLGLKEGLVECATVCVKSWVILTAVSPCMSSFIMHGQKWLILFFPSPRLCCCCCCLTQYSVVATAITYGTMFGLGTALAYTPPLGVAMRWFPKSKVPFIYYVSTFFWFLGPPST